MWIKRKKVERFRENLSWKGNLHTKQMKKKAKRCAKSEYGIHQQ
jgi:hypothetical protein